MADPTASVVSDLSSFLYISIILAAIAVARVGPLSEPRAADSLVGNVDDDAYGASYMLTSTLLIIAYLPSACTLAASGGGRPALLTLAVPVFVVASAPLAAIFRTHNDESAPARRIATAAALGAWAYALARSSVSGGLWALVFVGTVLIDSRFDAVVFPLQCAGFVALHLELGVAAPLPTMSGRWRWRVLAPLLLAPAAALFLTPILLLSAHTFFHLDERPVNHAGMPYCAFRHREVIPYSVEEVQQLVREHAHVRASGGRHSWSSLACPQVGGVVLNTELLRSVHYNSDAQTITAGAGASFGTITNALHRRNRMLSLSLHKDVTAAGAASTNAQHVGVAMDSIVVSLEVVYANGTLGTVHSSDEDFPYHFGSVGMLALIVSVTLFTIPRAAMEWTSTTETYGDNDGNDGNDAALAERVSTWADAPDLRTSVLWIIPSLRETTLQTATYGAPLEAPDNTTWRTGPELQRHRWGDVGLTYSLYNNGLALLIGLFDPLVLSISAAVAEQGIREFVSTYTTAEVSSPHLPTTGLVDEQNNLLPTLVATVEMDVSIDRVHIEDCVRALASFPLSTALHARYAPQADVHPLTTSGPGTYHIDFSLPESTLHRLRVDIERAVTACPAPVRADGFAASEGHAGKLNLADLLERRIWRAPAPATLPGRTASTAHVRFRELVAELDPLSKFTPVQ